MKKSNRWTIERAWTEPGPIRKYAELNKERTELQALKENLAARKKWLKDYDAAQAK